MNPIPRAKKVIITAFLLSLLFHTSSIIYILLKKTKEPQLFPQNKEKKFEQEIKKNELWAETKAKANNFGAPVLFQDEPDDDQSNQEKPLQELDQTIIETKIATSEITPTEIATEVHELSKVTQLVASTQYLDNTQQTPQQKNPVSTISQPPQKTINKKSPLSLAQLTQGFLNHVRNEGNHTIAMIGKKNSMPSDEQIKHERYLQKLSWCLQNSFTINNDRFPQSATTEATVHIFLALNKDGTMKQVNITKSSGNIHLDSFTLFIFHDASASFPPVPHYLPYDPFSITYVITINTADHNNIRIYRRR